MTERGGFINVSSFVKHSDTNVNPGSKGILRILYTEYFISFELRIVVVGVWTK